MRSRRPSIPYMICSEPSSVGSMSATNCHELVGLPVEVEPVERLQREGRVAHPGVAVVPVALAARRLGQRRRERRDGRAGRHVGQALDRERRALDRVAEAVVGDARPAEPVAPEARRRRDPRVGLADVPRRGELLGPRERAVRAVAGADSTCRARTRLPSMPSARSETSLIVSAGAGRVGLVPVAVRERPLRRRAAVVEDGLADELDLDRALDALDRAHEHVVAVVVGRRPRVRRDLVLARRAGPSSARRERRSSRPASSRWSRARSSRARTRARPDG